MLFLHATLFLDFMITRITRKFIKTVGNNPVDCQFPYFLLLTSFTVRIGMLFTLNFFGLENLLLLFCFILILTLVQISHCDCCCAIGHQRFLRLFLINCRKRWNALCMTQGSFSLTLLTFIACSSVFCTWPKKKKKALLLVTFTVRSSISTTPYHITLHQQTAKTGNNNNQKSGRYKTKYDT